MAAGLLLMSALYGNGLADRLAVRNARAAQRDIYAELRLQLGDDDIKVLFAHAADDHFFGFCVIFKTNRRVFFRKTHDALRDLIFVALVLRDDGHTHLRGGVCDAVQCDLACGCAERIARVDAGKLRDSADIARSDGLYIFLLFAAHHDGFADALRISGAHVDERGLCGDFAGEHLYVGEFADERVCNGLEDDGSRGGIFLNGNLNGVAVYVYADFRALIRRARGEPAKAVHKLLHAAHKHSVAAEYGRDGAAFNTLGNTDDNLFRREFFAGEIFLEQLVARFGDGLVNGGTQTLKTGAHVRHIYLYRLAAGVIVRLIFQHIDIFICLAVLKIRHNNRADGRAEARL